MNQLIGLGYRRPLTQSDLDSLATPNRSGVAYKKFKNFWKFDPDRHSETYPLIKFLAALFGSYWHLLALSASFKLCSSILLFISPVILDHLLNWLQNPDEPDWVGYV